MTYGWEGQKVRLVPLDRERHLENYLRWMNDPEVTRWLGGERGPVTRVAQEAWFDAHEKPDSAEVTFALETLEGVHIGTSSLMEIDRRNGRAVCGTLIGDRNAWGKGYGTDAARVRSRYAFEALGLRMLTSQVFAPNEASLRMLKRVGFVEYGRLPASTWIRGEYVDDVLLTLTHEHWQAGAEP